MAEPGSYRRIAEGLRSRIVAGELEAGGMVPSEASLVALHGVARGTVRAALSILADEGLIEVVPGQGRRVVGMPRNDRSPVTAYEHVAADLERRLGAGEFSASDRLPSEVELMAQFNVSRNTVRRAYRHLAEQGLVVIRHGSGAYPTPQ